MAFTLSGIYTAEVILNRGSAFKFKGRDGLLGKVKCREYICIPTVLKDTPQCRVVKYNYNGIVCQACSVLISNGNARCSGSP